MQSVLDLISEHCALSLINYVFMFNSITVTYSKPNYGLFPVLQRWSQAAVCLFTIAVHVD